MRTRVVVEIGFRGSAWQRHTRLGRSQLEKMVEDNEKMMEMMAQLFQRNEMQTRLLTSLSQRVEQLERAFACNKLRRKKKRNVDAKNKQSHHKNGFI